MNEAGARAWQVGVPSTSHLVLSGTFDFEAGEGAEGRVREQKQREWFVIVSSLFCLQKCVVESAIMYYRDASQRTMRRLSDEIT